MSVVVLSCDVILQLVERTVADPEVGGGKGSLLLGPVKIAQKEHFMFLSLL